MDDCRGSGDVMTEQQAERARTMDVTEEFEWDNPDKSAEALAHNNFKLIPKN